MDDAVNVVECTDQAPPGFLQVSSRTRIHEFAFRESLPAPIAGAERRRWAIRDVVFEAPIRHRAANRPLQRRRGGGPPGRSDDASPRRPDPLLQPSSRHSSIAPRYVRVRRALRVVGRHEVVESFRIVGAGQGAGGRRLARGVNAEPIADEIGHRFGHLAVGREFPPTMLTTLWTPSAAWSSAEKPREMPRRSVVASSGAYSGRTPHQVRTTGASTTGGSMAAHSRTDVSISQSARS